VYYLSYPHPSLKNWWVVYKVNPEMHTRRVDEYMKRHEDDDVYSEEIEGHQSFTVSDRAGLTELATGDVELLEEVPCPSKNAFRNQSGLLKDKKDVNDLMHLSLKQIQMLTTFDM
jgi:hypothetical protein